jgi:hypothetical protein
LKFQTKDVVDGWEQFMVIAYEKKRLIDSTGSNFLSHINARSLKLEA